MIIWILFIAIALASYIVSATLQQRFNKYSKIPLSNGMTGRDVAEKMLHDHGIYDVQITSTKGKLTIIAIRLTNDKPQRRSLFEQQCGSGCRCGSRNRTCRTTPSVCSFENAFCSSAGSHIPAMGNVGAGRHHSYPNLSCPHLDRNSHVCHDYFESYHITVEINASRRALAWLNHSG